MRDTGQMEVPQLREILADRGISFLIMVNGMLSWWSLQVKLSKHDATEDCDHDFSERRRRLVTDAWWYSGQSVWEIGCLDT